MVRPRLVLAHGLVATLWLSASCAPETQPQRLSAVGESCTRTADCVPGASCVGLTCVDKSKPEPASRPDSPEPAAESVVAAATAPPPPPKPKSKPTTPEPEAQPGHVAPPPTKPGCRRFAFTKPKRDGAKVGLEVPIVLQTDARKGEDIWLMAHRADFSKWWLQHPLRRVGDEWHGTAFIGQKRDIGHEFEIAAVAVSEAVSLDFKSRLDDFDEEPRRAEVEMPYTDCVTVRTVLKSKH